MASTLHHETPVLPPRSLGVAAFSTIVEWYDFTLYLYFATVLAGVFYGGGSGSLLLTLGGFAIAYLMRPLGAVFFSHIGDRYGRRRMLLISVALMTAAMLATALLPTRATAGPIAGWLLLALRCVMGFSVGGEYTGVVAYLLEGAASRRAARRRGLGADRQPDERCGTRTMGLAHPLLYRRRARRLGVDRPFDDARKSRVPPPAGPRLRPRGALAPCARQPPLGDRPR